MVSGVVYSILLGLCGFSWGTFTPSDLVAREGWLYFKPCLSYVADFANDSLNIGVYEEWYFHGTSKGLNFDEHLVSSEPVYKTFSLTKTLNIVLASGDYSSFSSKVLRENLDLFFGRCSYSAKNFLFSVDSTKGRFLSYDVEYNVYDFTNSVVLLGDSFRCEFNTASVVFDTTWVGLEGSTSFTFPFANSRENLIETMKSNYLDGFAEGKKVGYSNGYSEGYSKGQEGSETKGFLNVFTGLFNSLGGVLNIQIFPNFTLGMMFGIPLIILCVYGVLKLFR